MALGTAPRAPLAAPPSRRSHSPAYVAQIGACWRVVVPVRGKLSASLYPSSFPTRASADAWLRSAEGQYAVALTRGEVVSPN
jgi:hypothetical protein